MSWSGSKRVPRRGGGFSLVELLVTISIVGILAGSVVFSVAGARRVARDNRRISDTKLLYAAMEAYRREGGAIQQTDTDGSPCIGGGRWDCSFDGVFMAFLAPTYFAQVPVDPSHPGTSNFYAYRAYPGTSPPTEDGCPKPFYVIAAYLETDSPPDARSDASCFTGVGSGQDTVYIIVGR